MDNIVYFPLGVMVGDFFCNRDKERSRLKKNIQKGQHTILSSPRRYGKTSLSLQTFSELDHQWCYGSVDFLMSSNAESVQEKILSCVGSVIPKLLPTHKKIIDKIKSIFSFSQAKLSITALGPKVEFSHNLAPQDTIVEALVGLDKIAGEEGMRVVLLFDEFQQVGQISDNKTTEAAVRHAAERAKHVSYIFSGSNRHLLDQMFEDSNRPLYHLCVKMGLDRISEEHYTKHLNMLANSQWQSDLPPDILNLIYAYTKRHPYYMNLLCSRLWEEEKEVEGEKVKAIWEGYVNDEQGRIASDIADLSPNQKSVIRVLANHEICQPTSKKFLSMTNLSGTSAQQASSMLLKKDIVYKDHKGILRILDPAMEYYIRVFLS